jgi:hypothetical protein
VLTIVLAHVIDGYDVRVVQARGSFGLVVEALHVFRPSQMAAENHLHSDRAIGPFLPSPVHHAHAAAGDLVEQLIVAEIDVKLIPY